MELLSYLATGFAVALTPTNLLWCLLGTTLGTAIGVLPGLGPALTIALLWVAAGLVLNVLLIVPAGFTLASIILFVCVARGFGSRAILRDACIGAAFALTAYLGFAKTLGINIGSGLVEGVLERGLTAFGLGSG